METHVTIFLVVKTVVLVPVEFFGQPFSQSGCIPGLSNTETTGSRNMTWKRAMEAPWEMCSGPEWHQSSWCTRYYVHKKDWCHSGPEQISYGAPGSYDPELFQLSRRICTANRAPISCLVTKEAITTVLAESQQNCLIYNALKRQPRTAPMKQGRPWSIGMHRSRVPNKEVMNDQTNCNTGFLATPVHSCFDESCIEKRNEATAYNVQTKRRVLRFWVVLMVAWYSRPLLHTLLPSVLLLNTALAATDVALYFSFIEKSSMSRWVTNSDSIRCKFCWKALSVASAYSEHEFSHAAGTGGDAKHVPGMDFIYVGHAWCYLVAIIILFITTKIALRLLQGNPSSRWASQSHLEYCSCFFPGVRGDLNSTLGLCLDFLSSFRWYCIW